jgi:hypothetical protein
MRNEEGNMIRPFPSLIRGRLVMMQDEGDAGNEATAEGDWIFR